ncbi:MAG: aldo/keto reductase [Gammaproteobacteria bacterium]|nr:aldo/keto reductase [Pseudomonadales bacterium]MCP5348005.1 aldo/keto reductase [Pseudomonadales bacterium]
MILEETYTLSNGVTIPKLGLGTWFIDNDKAAQAVKESAALGYRHIDTAQAYGNEAGVGEGVRDCGVARGEMFVTTKLDAGIKSYQEAVTAIDASLQRMGLDYIDMMIIHSPQPWNAFGDENRYFEGNREAWRALEEASRAGKLRAIGLSNFQQQDIDNILAACSVRPVVNQILAHISNTPFELIQYSEQQKILVEAYSPVGHGELLKNDDIIGMAESYGVSVPQLCIRYVLQLGLLPLPKTANPAHMKNNADVDFEISAADMEQLKHMEKIQDYGEASVFPVYGGKMS